MKKLFFALALMAGVLTSTHAGQPYLANLQDAIAQGYPAVNSPCRSVL